MSISILTEALQPQSVFSGGTLLAKRLRLGMSRREMADAVGMDAGGDRRLRDWEEERELPAEREAALILAFPETPPFPDPADAPYRICDLFSGIGGMRLGFWQTGRTRTVFSSEVNRFCVKTYRANFGDTPSGDITQIYAGDLPDFDILVAGFPCQPLTQDDEKLCFNDAKGTLFHEVVRVLCAKRPSAFLLENMHTILTHNSGRTLKTMLSTLSEAGYKVHCRMLDSLHFGVPQKRERVYIVGFRADTVRSADRFRYPDTAGQSILLGDILEETVSEKYTLTDRMWAAAAVKRAEKEACGLLDPEELLAPDSPYAAAVTARYYKDSSSVLLAQKGACNPRMLTPRECARLQGFPEDFVIPVSDCQAYRQFGSAVTVPVIRAVAEQILAVLEQNHALDSVFSVPSIADLYAGCGGMSLGFRQAGFRVAGAFDSWKTAAECYAQNCDAPVYRMNLEDVPAAVHILDGLSPDVIIGGLPVQSLASDSGARGHDAVSCFAAIVSRAEPDFFVLETMPKAQGSSIYEKAVGRLRNTGYAITEIILDACRCGVPQHRKRLFCIGSMYGDDNFLRESLLGGLQDKETSLRDYLGTSLGLRFYYRHPSNDKRRAVYSIDEPVPSVREVSPEPAAGYRMHPRDAALATDNLRALTLRELALVQTFPPSFVWAGTKSDMEQMVGTAVPPSMARFIAAALMRFIGEVRKAGTEEQQEEICAAR